ncbi:ABC transporter permease [Brenneria sp. 4F2]|nr:ABC transporter permease [Brenneria bubanii]
MTMSSETSVVPMQSSGGISARLRAGLLTWPVMLGAVVLLIVVALALLAPWISHYNPIDIDPSQRLKTPSALHWLGTDALGRDIFARVVFGARQSLTVGLGAVCISVVIGLAIGVVAGYFRLVDAIVMRVMDGVMAIPGILLAIALVSLSGASLFTVLVAISIPEIPRVVRMVRSVIMGVRNESYVEAAVILGTPVPVIMWRHMLPSTVAPLIVQGTYIFASAILTEAILSFLGAGIPPEIPSWGNIMADGRVYFMMLPGMILYPGILVSLTVLSVNVLGDAVRDALDPRMAKRL